MFFKFWYLYFYSYSAQGMERNEAMHKHPNPVLLKHIIQVSLICKPKSLKNGFQINVHQLIFHGKKLEIFTNAVTAHYI